MTLRVVIGFGDASIPANIPPDTPTITAGTPEATTCTLSGSAFSDDDPGDTHATSYWDVATDAAFTNIVVTSGSTAVYLTSWPATGLTAETLYYARVRYTDSSGGHSEWSAATTFTTAAAVSTTYDETAELPRAEVDFTMPTTTATITVKSSGGDYATLQAAWNSLSTRTANTEIVIDAGYNPGTATVGAQTNDDTYWVVIRSANLSSLPRHVRVGPSDKADMPQLVVPSGGGAIVVGATTSKVRFCGISVEFASGSYQTHAIWVATGAEYIIFDRCLVKGQGLGYRNIRGLRLEGSNIGVIDSYIYDIVAPQDDTQAIWIYQGTGPFTIVNCYLEATGENFMSGGAAASAQEYLPQDITITRCYFYKPPVWYDNLSQVSVKNLLEIKHGMRFLIEKNILINNWADSQTGKAVIFKVDPQGGESWEETGHVTFRWNKVVNSPTYLQVAGQPEGSGVPVHDVSIHDNLAYGIGTYCTWPTGDIRGYICQGPTGGTIVIANETVITAGGMAAAFAGTEMNAWEQRDCIVGFGTYGWKGDGTASGTATFDAYCGTYVWEYMSTFDYGSTPSLSAYPNTNNHAYATLAACGFENTSGNDYRLASGSALKGTGSGGSDPGCDVATLNVYLANVTSGDFSSDPWTT